MTSTPSPPSLQNWLTADPARALREIEAEQCRRSLAAFIRCAWPILEPANPYIHGWHIAAIAEHLEACSRGQVRNLIINMPPRHAKSLLVSVFWPCWEWTFSPATRWLFSSYAAALSIRDSLKCRRLIESDWYQRRFGDRVTLTGDQNAKVKFENNATGHRLATSVGGVATGEGGDRIVTDDPNNVLEAESQAVRDSTNLWWDESMSTRGNNPKTVVRVVVQQRVHEDDLSGHLLRRGGYEHLCLPARFESTRAVFVMGKPREVPARSIATSIGFVDPRSEEGELLCPERFGEPELTELERQLGSLAAAGQLQQRPVPRGGQMFQRHWFEIVPRPAPEFFVQLVRYWDKAGTAGGGAYTAGALVARGADRGIYVVNIVRDQVEAGPRKTLIKQVALSDRATYGERVAIWQEQEPGSGGKEQAQSQVLELEGFIVHTERVTGDKETRATPLASQAYGGNGYGAVKLVEGAWVEDFLTEITSFPRGKYKDQVDATAGAFNKIALHGEAQTDDDVYAMMWGQSEIDPWQL